MEFETTYYRLWSREKSPRSVHVRVAGRRGHAFRSGGFFLPFCIMDFDFNHPVFRNGIILLKACFR